MASNIWLILRTKSSAGVSRWSIGRTMMGIGTVRNLLSKCKSILLQRSSESWLIRCRSRIKSYQYLSGCMAQVIKLWSWLITHRVIQHGQRMHCMSKNMNLNPGGKVPYLQDGWFIHNSVQVSQPMVFPPNHPTFPDQPKGIKVVLAEHSLWHHRMLLICWDSKCNPTLISCCATWTLKHQPDFLTQKSLVQEAIEVAR